MARLSVRTAAPFQAASCVSVSIVSTVSTIFVACAGCAIPIFMSTKYVATMENSCYGQFMLVPEQSRAARGLLCWSQDKLAKIAKVGLSTVRDFEKGRHTPIPENLDAIFRALQRAGVEFISENGGGPGVRLRKRLRRA